MGRLDASDTALKQRQKAKRKTQKSKFCVKLSPFCLLPFAFCLLPSLAFAHVGSPDVFFEGQAGPYSLTVVVRPPGVVPGLAQVEVLLDGGASGEIKAIHVQPVTYTTKDLGAPVPDLLRGSPSDPHFFSGEVWFMASGSYSVRVMVDGTRGSGQVNIPVPSTARTTQSMNRPLGALLFALMALLVAAAVGIVGASVREGQLPPGAAPEPQQRRRGRLAMGLAFLFCLGAVWFGNSWWSAEASAYARYIYKPLEMTSRVVPQGGATRLLLEFKDPGWLPSRRLDDLVEDHGHLVHLFLVRFPAMDAFYHLHPAQVQAARLEQVLPQLPAGRYKLFADIVHRTGFPETAVAEVNLSQVAAGELQGDDSGNTENTEKGWKDTEILWERPSQLRPRQPVSLIFRVEDGKGHPVEDLEPYMGMPGHAVVVRRDASVFAHLHPMGSVPMAALQVFEKNPSMSHRMHAVAPVISFPYGFPQAGSYRIWVQVKRHGRVVTGVFDCEVKS